jgi:hypothetical protein
MGIENPEALRRAVPRERACSASPLLCSPAKWPLRPTAVFLPHDSPPLLEAERRCAMRFVLKARMGLVR